MHHHESRIDPVLGKHKTKAGETFVVKITSREVRFRGNDVDIVCAIPQPPDVESHAVDVWQELKRLGKGGRPAVTECGRKFRDPGQVPILGPPRLPHIQIARQPRE